MKGIFEKRERKAGRGGKSTSITYHLHVVVTSESKKDHLAVLNMVREDRPGVTFELQDIPAYENGAAYKAASEERATNAKKAAALASLKRLTPEQIAALRGLSDDEVANLEATAKKQAEARRAEEEKEAAEAKAAADKEAAEVAGAAATA